MKRRTLGVALFLSLLVNLGLNDEQRRAWHGHEADFLDRLVASSREIRAHRDRLVHEIFGAAPDAGIIEAERASIARIQEAQQRLVTAQLLSERDLLDLHQRALLAQVLIDQSVGRSLWFRAVSSR